MKKRIIGILSAAVIIIVSFRTGMVFGSSGNEAGTTSDPLITKSYLEKRLKEISGDAYSDPVVQTGSGEQLAYRKVSVTKGKYLLVAEGGEFIIYSGSGVILGDRGAMDLLEGEVNKTGSSTLPYHNYLSLSQNSGVKAVSSCIIYVRGDYTIKS